jgi:hypothetical protein
VIVAVAAIFEWWNESNAPVLTSAVGKGLSWERPRWGLFRDSLQKTVKTSRAVQINSRARQSFNGLRNASPFLRGAPANPTRRYLGVKRAGRYDAARIYESPKNSAAIPAVSIKPWASTLAHRLRPASRYADPSTRPENVDSTIPAGPL